MSLKKKLTLGVASAALGLSLIGGGTYAYFSDTEVNNSSFAAGTLDINVKGNDAANAIIDVSNIKPGDKMFRTFKLNNTGSLDVSKVLLTSNYSVIGDANNGGDDFGKHIKVKFLTNLDKVTTVIAETTLDKLSQYDVTDNKNGFPINLLTEKDGLKSGDNDTITVQFEFVDNGQDQNHFQGDSLKLNWTFTAQQTAGNPLK
ncbi:cell division protein FtsN [Neobacillus sp. MM2021_6]|uniref:TasA family protein n=1 Tax=Bacillaceae TaxID=186817 RepID=UPI001408619F|nr:MULTISPECIES: TasA family protein [Bacillaceae]MBO0958278.1 cell division protein FtsN [Neobacillus sp. MM2021_6]NHC17878.1 cell division protein FtsN [Bacillus sp. MM2020_4]